MTVNSRFNMLAAEPGDHAFIHTANSTNILGHITTIDHPSLNNNLNSRLIVTRAYGRLGPYNNQAIGVYYTGTRWAIFNQNLTAMPVGAQFNVLVDDQILQAVATTPNENWFTIDHASTNDQPTALLFTTQYWTAVYTNQEIGVWFDGSRWAIYNQGLAPMPQSARCFVLRLQ